MADRIVCNAVSSFFVLRLIIHYRFPLAKASSRPFLSLSAPSPHSASPLPLALLPSPQSHLHQQPSAQLRLTLDGFNSGLSRVVMVGPYLCDQLASKWRCLVRFFSCFFVFSCSSPIILAVCVSSLVCRSRLLVKCASRVAKTSISQWSSPSRRAPQQQAASLLVHAPFIDDTRSTYTANGPTTGTLTCFGELHALCSLRVRIYVSFFALVVWWLCLRT